MVPEMSADEIMNVAEAKYKIMVGKGTWNAVTKKEESFIALQAAYDTMLKKHSAPRKGDGRANPLGKKKKAISNQSAWKEIAPTGNEPTEKAFF